jgi:hypothetical protein
MLCALLDRCDVQQKNCMESCKFIYHYVSRSNTVQQLSAYFPKCKEFNFILFVDPE